MDTGTKFVLFFLATFLLVLIAILFALRPEYLLNKKKLQKKRAQQQRATPNNVTSSTHLPTWPLIPLVLFFFGMLIGMILLLRFVYLKIKYFVQEIKISTDSAWLQWISKNLFWLFLITIVIIALALIWKFRSYIKPSLPKIKIKAIKWKWSWKWLWVIPALFVIYLIYYEWKSDKIKKDAWRPNVVIDNSNRVDPLIGSPYLNMDGEKKNVMQKGEFFQFDVNWDEPGISFDPETSEKVVLYFQKAEDPTRNWRLILWKNKRGEKEYLFSPSAPIAEALIGKVYVKSEISSVNVVVSRK
ncbi:MAG: hypothetical protein QG674_343 [Patescibacteria group bacterium]|nr:hypothetical protein [Patescibacteria group bacterium]